MKGYVEVSLTEASEKCNIAIGYITKRREENLEEAIANLMAAPVKQSIKEVIFNKPYKWLTREQAIEVLKDSDDFFCGSEYHCLTTRYEDSKKDFIKIEKIAINSYRDNTKLLIDIATMNSLNEWCEAASTKNA